MHHVVEDFGLGGNAMRYSLFVPRLYNYCLSLGFRRDRMLPSRAFCSDESQGYPVTLLMQHFGTFPFDHGRVGGKVALDRHGPHAHHGEDLVIIQASHVGYDPEQKRFGLYKRPRTASRGFGDNCGKLCAVLKPYQAEYRRACDNIMLGEVAGTRAIFIDNHFLAPDRAEGLFLHLDLLAASHEPLKILSTSKAFPAASRFMTKFANGTWPQARTPIGALLSAEYFSFRRTPLPGPEGDDLLEASLVPVMQALVTSTHPALDAARYHTQMEFDRTYRSLQAAPEYRGKNLLFIAGLNIDVSPPEGVEFPLTKFVPWAAYLRLRDGTARVLEQEDLVETLNRQPTTNPDKMSLDTDILAMTEAETISLPL
jgi:hypothetical protein